MGFRGRLASEQKGELVSQNQTNSRLGTRLVGSSYTPPPSLLSLPTTPQEFPPLMSGWAHRTSPLLALSS